MLRYYTTADYLHKSKSASKTGIKFNIAGSVVLDILSRHNIPAYSGRSIIDRIDDETRKNVKSDKLLGLTFRELENKYNLGRNTIRCILRNQ